MIKKPKLDAPVLSRSTPRKSADEFKHRRRPDLIRFQEDWLDYDGSAYRMIDNETMEAEIADFLASCRTRTKDGKEVPFNPKVNDINEVYSALSHICNVPPGTLSPPSWLDGLADIAPRNIISCQNGLLDITTRVLHPATSAFFTRTAIPLHYDPNAPAPARWTQFVHEITGGDLALAQLLQEMFGYLISDDTSQQRIFFMIGEPGTGKGTVLRMLEHIVGTRNCHSVTIESLASHFGLESVSPCSIMIVTDMTCHDQQKLSAAANRLNMISGEDNIAVPRKHKTDLEDQRLRARPVIAGNNMPNFGEHSAAIGRRLIFLVFNISFADDPDRRLEGKLLAESAGILNWALDGLASLTARGYFVIPASSEKERINMLYLADPVRGFVNERCIVEAAQQIVKRTLYVSYCDFCSDMGVKPLSMEVFARRLYAVAKGSDETRSRDGSNRVQMFTGVTLEDRYKEDTAALEQALREFFEVPEDVDLALLGETVTQYVKRSPKLAQ